MRIVWDVMPYNVIDLALLACCFLLVTYLAYLLKLKMEAVQSFIKLVKFYHTTWCKIAENNTLHSHHCENSNSTSRRSMETLDINSELKQLVT